MPESPARCTKTAVAISAFPESLHLVETAHLGRSEYGLRMIEECKLTPQDFWVPGGPKAIDRKGGVLKTS